MTTAKENITVLEGGKRRASRVWRKFKRNQGVRKIAATWNENPFMVIGAATVVAATMAKVGDMLTGIQSRRAYAKRMGRSKYDVRGRR